MDKTLKKRRHNLSDPVNQVLFFEEDKRHTRFEDKLSEIGLFPLNRGVVEIFQMNIGKMCNQACKHCHVDAGPGRKEIMTKATMESCIKVIKQNHIKLVDITGGAPEMNPNFKWLIEELAQLDCTIIVRCNLTIVVESNKYAYLPAFYKENKIHLVSSLPYFAAKRTNAQRGEGVFEKSIQALKLLNNEGYGQPDSGLKLDLVYNPSGAFLPGDQTSLERQFKQKLVKEYNIEFNNLLAITNLPVSRFLAYLVASEKYDQYMEELVNAFNPVAAESVMCRNTISVSWDGFLFDCDFNQMLNLKIGNEKSFHITDVDWKELLGRSIAVNKHCFGCTAGSGSSCGGATA